MSVKHLQTYLTPPHHPRESGSSGTWATVEAQLGTALPEDYKTFINQYGTGIINDFLIPLSPFATNWYYNLLQVLEELHRSEHIKQQNFPADATSVVHPFRLHPDKDGLLPWATTTNFGDYLFWQVVNQATPWPILIYNLRDGDYETFHTDFSSFMVDVISGTIRSALFPDNVFVVGSPAIFHPLET